MHLRGVRGMCALTGVAVEAAVALDAEAAPRDPTGVVAQGRTRAAVAPRAFGALGPHLLRA
ncbi:MAG: hypothetical protein ACE10D_07410 [Planctomycetota bacterium]